jgi:hypothetical protein
MVNSFLSPVCTIRILQAYAVALVCPARFAADVSIGLGYFAAALIALFPLVVVNPILVNALMLVDNVQDFLALDFGRGQAALVNVKLEVVERLGFESGLDNLASGFINHIGQAGTERIKVFH